MKCCSNCMFEYPIDLDECPECGCILFERPKTKAYDEKQAWADSVAAAESGIPYDPSAFYGTGFPILGVRFAIEEVSSDRYGHECWKIIWGALEPRDITPAKMSEGDTEETMEGNEGVFCIAFQSSPEHLECIKRRLCENQRFLSLCAEPKFVEWDADANVALAPAGRITRGGLFSVSAFNARNAWADLKGVEIPSSFGDNWVLSLPLTDLATADEVGLPAHSLYSDEVFLASGRSSTPSRMPGFIAVVVILILAATLLFVVF